MRPIYWLAMVAAALGWASGGIATRAAFDEGVGEWTVIGVRIVLAALLVVVVLVVQRTPMPSWTVMGYGFVQGVFNMTIPYVLFTFAYGEASAGFVGLIAALIPLGTAVFANFMLPDEPLTRTKLVALFVAFSGVAFLLLSGDSGLSEGGRPVVAGVLGLISVISIGFANSFAKRHAGAYEPIMITGLQFFFAAVWLVPVMLVVEGLPADVSATGWALLVEMAVFATFMPLLLGYWLLTKVSATEVSLIGYMIPFMVLIGGLVLLDEQLQPGIIIGGFLVLIGLYLSDRASRRADGDVAPETWMSWPHGCDLSLWQLDSELAQYDGE
jgi:drug/metabolite transporter (DMT)-like permease